MGAGRRKKKGRGSDREGRKGWRSMAFLVIVIVVVVVVATSNRVDGGVVVVVWVKMTR